MINKFENYINSNLAILCSVANGHFLKIFMEKASFFTFQKLGHNVLLWNVIQPAEVKIIWNSVLQPVMEIT